MLADTWFKLAVGVAAGAMVLLALAGLLAGLATPDDDELPPDHEYDGLADDPGGGPVGRA